MRTPQQIALLIFILFIRSRKNRTKISDVTFKKLAKRQNLRASLVNEVARILDFDYGLLLHELDIGGFGILPTKVLQGASSTIATRVFSEEEQRGILGTEELDWQYLENEAHLALDKGDGNEEEEE